MTSRGRGIAQPFAAAVGTCAKIASRTFQMAAPATSKCPRWPAPAHGGTCPDPPRWTAALPTCGPGYAPSTNTPTPDRPCSSVHPSVATCL